MPFIRHKWDTMEILYIHLEGYNTLLLWVELNFAMQPVAWQTKLWHLPYLVSKVSNDVFNIWLVTHINVYFILLILMMDQISSGLHGVEIKVKTTQPNFFRISPRCRPCQNYQQKTVIFGYYPHSIWCFCLLESTDSASYSIWLHWRKN